jgi:hypothetical protein
MADIIVSLHPVIPLISMSDGGGNPYIHASPEWTRTQNLLILTCS